MQYCCGLDDLLDKVNPGGAGIKTWYLTCLLWVIVIIAVDCLVYLLFQIPPVLLKDYNLVIMAVIVGALNYLLVFRKEKYRKYNRTAWPGIFVILITILVLSGSIYIIALSDPRRITK